jgi:hypothetical protein
VRRQLVALAPLSQNDVTSSLEHYASQHTAKQLLIDRGCQRSTKGGGRFSESSSHVIRGYSDAVHAMIRRRWKPIRGLVRLQTPVRPPDSNELRPVGP